jgi:malonate transporter and related proteins
MGLGLRRYGISGNVLAGASLTVLKLGLMPAVVLALAYMFGLPPLAAQVAVATAAMPSGVNCYLIAVQFGTGQALASNAMTLATAAAVGTTALWLSVAAQVLG